MTSFVHFLTIEAAAVCMFVSIARHPEWCGGLLTLGFVFLAAAFNECADFWQGLLPAGLPEPEILPITLALVAAAACAYRFRGTTITAAFAVFRNRRLPLLVWGLIFVTVLPNLAKSRPVWDFFLGGDAASHEVRDCAKEAVKFFGDVLLLNWAILFLKDKWRVTRRRTGSLNELVFKHELVEIGRGTRRVAYRVGDTGYCVKFYYPQEQCTEALKMQKSIQRDVRWRRFNKARNSSSAEVYIYDLFRHTMPEDIRAAMPPVCERVYHPVWGWGILETFYTNPDGSAIRPYEDEIARSSKEDRETIYALAVDMLDRVIKAGALLYEPGNFHVLRHEDGSMELKLVDFEPESKTAIPLERVWKSFRQRKLRRKAKRYLAHIRSRFGVREVSLDQLAAESAFGTKFTGFSIVTGGHQSANYRARTADGAECLVKFAGEKVAAREQEWLEALASPLVPSMKFDGRTGRRGRLNLFAIEWRDGRSMDPAEMNEAQVKSLVKSYLEFSKALQRISNPPAENPFPESEYSHGLIVIHGDLHYHNLLFMGDEVSAFLDFEKMRKGNPAEDLLRYFMHAMERTRFFRVTRLAAIRRNFALAVRMSPWDAATWQEAISLYERRKSAKRMKKSGGGVFAQIERTLRSPLYRGLEKIVREVKQ